MARTRQLLAGTAALLALLGTSPDVAAQAGKNGPLTVAATGTILNEYTTLTANAAVGATTITVGSSTLNANGRFLANLAAGDLLLIVQPQGATINTTDAAAYGTVTALNNAGRYQLVEVASVPSATSINLSCRIFSPFTTAGHTQVVRVPRYTTLSLNASVAVTAQAWNGSTGGVMAIETTGAVMLGTGATLDVSALGFRGGAVEQNSDAPGNTNYGYRSANSAYSAEKGEGIAGSVTEYDGLNGRYGRGAPANGGGGGNSHNAAGGGGANAAVTGATYTGLGNPDRGPANAYDAAWNLEAANFATSTSSGGGRGGYSYSASNQDALTVGPNQASWNGDLRQNKGGLGGRPVANSGRAFFGGGGGAGDSNNNSGTGGGVGGGFIYLVAGGAVSGGSLLANGGSVTTNSNNDGAGGGGGGGYLAYTAGTPTTDVSGGLNGTSASSSVTEFPPDGGTRGGAGLAEGGGVCTVALCPAAVVNVATTVSFATNPLPANQAATINVTFVNNGPDAAANVVRLVQLPAGLGAGNVTVTTATGTGTYNDGTGQVTFTPSPLPTLANGANADATISYTPTTAGSLVVSSTISTTTDEACQTSDNSSGNNTLVVIFPADVQVTLSGPSTAAAGSTITYTATVQNITPVGPGTADATSVVLTVQLPRALLAYTFPAGTVYDFNTGIATLNVGLVSRGAAALSYPFTFTLPNNTQGAAGVASTTAFEPDPNANNNNGSTAPMQVATTVTLPAGTGTCSGSSFNASPATQGLYAEYYKNYFNDVITFFNAPKVPQLVRTDGTVNYTTNNGWGDLSSAIAAGNNTNPDSYSSRYRGYVTIATAGTYTFTLISDDASYLWLDNGARANPLVVANAVVNNGGAHAPVTVTSAPMVMRAGAHPLLALFGENGGGNIFRMLYSGPDTGGATVVVPQSALCNRQFSGPLPVELTAFTAQAEGRTARLSWRTASEKNNDYFEVQRSRDGSAFSKIGVVSGHGTSSMGHDYAFADASAAEAGGGSVYYRLLQVDTDGTQQYSPVRVLDFAMENTAKASFHLYPNPAQRRVTMELTGALSATAPSICTLTDLTGRVLLKQVVEAGAAAPTFDLSALPIGVYLVQVEQLGRRYTQRLVHTQAAE